MEAALSLGIKTVYCDFEDPKKYREAVKRFVHYAHPQPKRRSSGWRRRASSKWARNGPLSQVRSCEADGYLVRNYDHLQVLRQ